MKNGSKVHQQPNESPVEQEWSGRFLPEKKIKLSQRLWMEATCTTSCPPIREFQYLEVVQDHRIRKKVPSPTSVNLMATLKT